MKATEINAIFSAKVAEYLTNGYEINANTMNGSQGEIAKVDFRKGSEVIRIVLFKKSLFTDNWMRDAIVLLVGRCTDERVIKVTSFDQDPIIWNGNLETVEERTFVKMGRWGTNWYVEGKEAEEAMKKNRDRAHAHWNIDRMETERNRKEYTGEEIKEILLPAIRRHLERPKLKADRIDKIVRVWKENRFEYTVTTLGKRVAVLH